MSAKINSIDYKIKNYFKITCIPDSDFEKKVNLYLMSLIENKNEILIDHRCISFKQEEHPNKINTQYAQELNDSDSDTNVCNFAKIPYSGIELVYKEKKILAKPIVYENGKFQIGTSRDNYSAIYYNLLIFIENGNEVFANNLYIDADNWFTKVYMDQSISKNKIKLFIWNEWSWNLLSKIKKRDKDTVYLPDDQVNNIINSFTNFFSNDTKKLYEHLNITYKKCLLFEGPPGTGKSSLIKALGSHFNKNIAYLNICPEYNEKDLFKTVRNIPNEAILVIEDIDSVFEKREKTDHKNCLSFSGLLNGLDGLIEPKNGQIIILTTNYRNKLDGALKRPGRIDEMITFDYCKKNEIQKIYDKFFPSESKFEELYKHLKNIKNLTISYLQQYFLKYLNDTENLYKKTSEINDIIEECHLYQDNSKYLYN